MQHSIRAVNCVYTCVFVLLILGLRCLVLHLSNPVGLALSWWPAFLCVMGGCFLSRQPAAHVFLGSQPASPPSLSACQEEGCVLFLAFPGQMSVWPWAGQHKGLRWDLLHVLPAKPGGGFLGTWPCLGNTRAVEGWDCKPLSLALRAKVADSPDGSSGTRRTSLSPRFWHELVGTLR